MKNSTKFFMYLLLVVLLSACSKPPTDVAPTAPLTEIPLTATAPILTTSPITPTATVKTIATPNPTFTPIMQATIEPTIAPTIDPAEIKASLKVETLGAFNDHNLRRISGGSNGFAHFEWMSDSKHILLAPITGKGTANDGSGRIMFLSYAAVINLDSTEVWMQNDNYSFLSPKAFNPFSPNSFPQARLLLKADTDTSILVYGLDGSLLKTYQGTLIGASPSGNKILIAENVADTTNGKVKWVDLKNNKEVMFTWETTLLKSHPCCGVIWSPDEMSVLYPSDYGGNFYGNAKNGESYLVSYIPNDEEDPDYLIGPPQHFLGKWVLNDTYLLTRWYEVYVGKPGYLSVFDPAKQAYRNLSALVGLPYVLELYSGSPSPYPCEDGQPSAAPGGRYVWVNCVDGGELIDMQTFKTQSYPRYPETELEWSADGNFAFLNYSDDSPWQQILSAANNQVTEMPTDAKDITWHPTQNIFAYLSKSGRTLTIFNAEKAAIQKQVDLPVVMRYFDWNTRGDKIALTAEDKSIWQIDTATLGNLDQLTSPMVEAQGAIWSPDGSSIAFSVKQDIYIVDVSPLP